MCCVRPFDAHPEPFDSPLILSLSKDERTAMRKLRLACRYYRNSWHGWVAAARVLRCDVREDNG